MGSIRGSFKDERRYRRNYSNRSHGDRLPGIGQSDLEWGDGSMTDTNVITTIPFKNYWQIDLRAPTQWGGDMWTIHIESSGFPSRKHWSALNTKLRRRVIVRSIPRVKKTGSSSTSRRLPRYRTPITTSYSQAQEYNETDVWGGVGERRRYVCPEIC
jgi:hypothetical protein